MNATEARQLATKSNTDDQAAAIKGALDKIKWEAQRGRFAVTLFPQLDLIQFVKFQLEILDYTVRPMKNSDQGDGPYLEVSW